MLRLLGLLLGGSALASLSACALSTPPAYDLRAAYMAASADALPLYLDCDGVNVAVCTCRTEGLEEQLAFPGLGKVDTGYAALAAYNDDPKNADQPHHMGEAHALSAIFISIKADVEDVCRYYEQPSTE